MRSPETILLIGGRGGIGSALATALVRQGHRVLATSRKPADADPAIVTLPLDLESADLRTDLERLVASHPDIDVVMHCAGRNSLAGFTGLGDGDIDRMLTVNLRSAITVGAVFGEHFRHRGRGQLLYVGSTLGSIGMPGYSAYCASKFGLRGYAEALRRELLGSGVDVLFVAPRATRTSMNSSAVNTMNKQLGNVMDAPELVAERILRAWTSARPRTFLGWPEKLFVFINALFPALVDKAMVKQNRTIKTYLVSGENQS